VSSRIFIAAGGALMIVASLIPWARVTFSSRALAYALEEKWLRITSDTGVVVNARETGDYAAIVGPLQPDALVIALAGALLIPIAILPFRFGSLEPLRAPAEVALAVLAGVLALPGATDTSWVESRLYDLTFKGPGGYFQLASINSYATPSIVLGVGQWIALLGVPIVLVAVCAPLIQKQMRSAALSAPSAAPARSAGPPAPRPTPADAPVKPAPPSEGSIWR
jgi:hypothetical protein